MTTCVGKRNISHNTLQIVVLFLVQSEVLKMRAHLLVNRFLGQQMSLIVEHLSSGTGISGKLTDLINSSKLKYTFYTGPLSETA